MAEMQDAKCALEELPLMASFISDFWKEAVQKPEWHWIFHGMALAVILTSPMAVEEGRYLNKHAADELSFLSSLLYWHSDIYKEEPENARS